MSTSNLSLDAPRNRTQSAAAVFAGFALVVALSLGTDQVLHVLHVYPPWGEPMPQPPLNLLALGYRTVYAVLGCALAAWLAPRAPMRHAWIVGGIGLVVGTLGAITTIPMELGPAWYPIGLALEALPCAWLGGRLHRRAAQRG